MTKFSGQVVWTIKIRLLHWLMAVFVLINLFLYTDGDDIHNWLGYGTLAIVFLRVVLGLTSKGYDGFRNFPLNIFELFYFFRNLFNRNRKNFAGHNPAASYAYLVFWLLIIGLGVSGILLVHVEEFFGSQTLESLHEFLANAVIIFVALHFTGIIFDAVIHRRKTWMSIFNGKK